MYKNLFSSGEYSLKNKPYKLRGVILPRKEMLESEVAGQKKPETKQQEIERLEEELSVLESLIAGKKTEISVLEEQYNELVKKAAEDADLIREAAEESARQLKEAKSKQGYEEGFDKGYYDGMEKGKNEADRKAEGFITALSGMAQTAETEKQKIIKGTEENIVDLSIAIARKVVDRELDTDRKLVINFVKEAIKKLEDKEKVVIYAHPDDIAIIKEAREEFRSLVDAEDKLHILPDDLLERSECRLESKSEIIDTDLNYQFGEIRKKLNPGN